jgi:uncharacterized protein (TIGR03437 family)
MMKSLRLVLFAALFAACLPARQEQAVCGTHRDKWQETVYLHRQAERRRLARKLENQTVGLAAASTRAAARDSGNIAIMEDGDGVVDRMNSFTLNGRTIAFQPTTETATKYRFETREASYDESAATSGAPLTGLGDDDTREVPLPFSFAFYGISYRSVFVNSDGNLTFGAGDAAASARSLGRMSGGQPRIAGLFRDLDPSRTNGGVRVLTEASRLVVSWVNVPEYSDLGFGTQQTFQIRLYSDGRIQIAFSGVNTLEAVVGISPGGAIGTTSLVSFSTGSSDEFSATIAELYTNVTEVDIVTAARKFFETHEDAYDYLVIFNNLDVPAATGAVAYEVTLRNQRTGYGDPVSDQGALVGSASRLQSIMNMGPLSQYPEDPNSVVPARYTSRDTPLTVLGHEAGHLFLAFASVRDPNDPSARPMLGRQSAHWNFAFNSEASFLEGNRIQDNGTGGLYRFRTIATVEGYAPLDQYLMGFRAPEEVPATFLVTNPTTTTASRAPQSGVVFNGDRRDVTVQDIIAVEGRRTPDHTVSQRKFRFGFILVVAQGSAPSQADLDKVESFRKGFEDIYYRASSERATADATLRRSLKLSVWPAAGVVAGSSFTASVAVEKPVTEPLVVQLKSANGAVEIPATVTIPANQSSSTFAVKGAREGVDDLTAEAADGSFETAAAKLQVLGAAAQLKLVVASGDKQVAASGSPLANPIVVRVTDVNNLPYPGVRVQASATTGGKVEPSAATTGEKGTASFAWTPAANVSNELRISAEGATTVVATALGKPSFSANAVVNAASFAAGIAPGSFATIFGVNLAGGSAIAARVIVNARAIVPVFISEGQINFLVPDDIPEGTADVSVTTPVGASGTVKVTSTAISLGIFFDVSSGLGAILYNAADPSVLEIYATGLGPLRSDASGLFWTKATVEASIAGQTADVLFSGQAPGYPGLYQVNVRIPAGVATGLQPLVLRVGSSTSNEVKVQVR